jgi:hypothetical protein
MTKILIATLAGLVAGLSASPDAPAPRAADRVAVVVDASGPGAEERLAAAHRAATVGHAAFRAPRTLRDQVSVTTALASAGYTTIVGFGLEAAASIAPLHGRVRYVTAD